MGKLVTSTLNRNKAKKQYSLQQYINWYIRDLEEFYPEVTKDMKDYKSEIQKMGEEASSKLSISIMRHCAFQTENLKLKEMLTGRYVGVASAKIIKNKNAKSIWDLVNFLVDLKNDDERFANMNIDYKKYSEAMADTKDLKYNRYWIESYDEYQANYEFLINSNDAESACFLANNLVLSKEDFKHCEEIVLSAKNAELSHAFFEIDGANKAKHRKVIIDSKNSLVNSHFLIDQKCTVKQVSEHKAAIYTSTDENKLKALVFAITEKPEIFSETEINDVVKTLVRTRNTQLARILSTSNNLESNQLAKLEKLILNSKDKSAIHTLTNVRYSEQTRKLAKEREKELSVSL